MAILGRRPEPFCTRVTIDLFYDSVGCQGLVRGSVATACILSDHTRRVAHEDQEVMAQLDVHVQPPQ
jgi:hypothetical protein